MPPISCEEVWRELSNYIDGDIDPGLRAEMEAHFKQCKHCAALLDGTRNVVELVGDDRAFALPAGFSRRLEARLAKQISATAPSASPAISARLWWASGLAACFILASFALFHARERAAPSLKSRHSQPAVKLVASMVAVGENGKTFHVPGCPYLRGRVRLITMEAAVRSGFVPCIHCERKLLRGEPERGPEAPKST